MKKLLAVIPCYNEEGAIEKTIKDVKKNLSFCDYIVINDCSTDKTKEILEKGGYNHIDLISNLGLSGAVQTGFKYAYDEGYECAIQFDGDGQHQGKYIKAMFEEIENGADIVIGSRFVIEKKDMSPRMLGSRIISFLIKVKTGKTISDPTSGMRMLNRKMLYEYAYNVNSRPEPDTLAHVMKNGAVVKEVQVTMKDRETGASIYSSIWPSVKYMIKMVVGLLFLS